jgi:hypothetical protein
MPAPTAAQPVEKLWQQVNRLSEEVEDMKQQIWNVMRARRRPVVVPHDAEVDTELRALVGIDPPLSSSQERAELRRILARKPV